MSSFTTCNLSSLRLSLLSRLHLEELILTKPPLSLASRNLFLFGSHSPPSLPSPPPPPPNPPPTPPPCVIVMGIGGKIRKLVNPSAFSESAPIPVLRRFSGGGTVVADPGTLFTTVISRGVEGVPPFPREIMEYTGVSIFGPTFAKLASLSKPRKSLATSSPSCGATNVKVHARPLPFFEVLENDYTFVLPDEQKRLKIAGNAQSIKGKSWLHHTSFLWDVPRGLEYLKLPEKRPEYREGRDHSDFIVGMGEFYPELEKEAFYEAAEAVLLEQEGAEKIAAEVLWEEVMEEVGGEAGWLEWCGGGRGNARTSFVDEEGERTYG